MRWWPASVLRSAYRPRKSADLRLDRLRQQGTRPVAQNLSECIGESPWLSQLDHVSVGHGVSLLQWRSGGVEHPHDTPPHPFMPSPTSAHSSNATRGSFSSGIAVWDTQHTGTASEHVRILGNAIAKATSWDFASPEQSKTGAAPQEAISIAGAVDFEVAYNHVYDSGKEGIDIKETSKHGKVHHNLVNNVLRQGIYVDAGSAKLTTLRSFPT